MNNKINILIADDTPTMRHLIKGILLNAGYKNFTEVENGMAVMEKLKQNQFHLIICDWDMPKMDGLEVLRYVRQHTRHALIPFVLVTAISDASKVVTAVAQGMDDYIIKPIRADDFIRRVNAVLQKSKLAAAG